MRGWGLVLLGALVGCGGNAVSQGAAAFHEGDLDAAIAPWEEVARSGQGSGRLHFNLGNAWYRKGELARAVGHYRLAQQLRPRDGNVQHNLALARADLEGPIPDPAPPVLGWMAFATPGELGVAGVLLTGLGSALALRWRRRPGRGDGLPALTAWLLGVVLAVTSLFGAQALQRHPHAVVLERAVVRDLPRTDAAERFELPVGSELTVVRELGDFVLVEDGRERRGWMRRAALLVPGRPGE